MTDPNDEFTGFWISPTFDEDLTERDDMAAWCSINWANKEAAEILCDNIFTLLCVLAWNDVCGKEDRTGTVELWKLLAAKFDSAYESLVMREYFIVNLMRHLPSVDTFPDCVKIHIAAMQNTKVGVELLRKKEVKTADVEEQRLIGFGAKVFEVAHEAKASINNQVNPKWVKPKDRPSGDGYSRTAILDGLLKLTWEMDVSIYTRSYSYSCNYGC